MASSDKVIQAADNRAPSGSSAPTAKQDVTGTAATSHATALVAGEMATVKNNSPTVPMRVGFAGTQAGAVTAAATGITLGPYERYDWLVCSKDTFVGMIAKDGTSTFDASVWTSSGPRAGE